jgi:hypothetical protein
MNSPYIKMVTIYLSLKEKTFQGWPDSSIINQTDYW